MPQFKPNPEAYGPGGYDMIADDGSVFPDPWGQLAAESAAPAAGMSATPAEAAAFIAPPTPAMGPPAPAQAHAPPPDPTSLLGMADRELATTSGIDQSGLPPPAAPGAASSAAPTAPPDPAQVFGLADKTATSTTSTSSSETSSTGLSDADQAAAGAAIGNTAQLKQQAGQEKFNTSQLESQQLDRRRAELLAQGAEGLEAEAAKLAVQDKVEAEVEKKLRAGAEFRPDRTELFHGDRGALFGISAAVAAMAGGWLMGQGKTGGRNPYLDVVLKLIDDNANDQIRKNSSVVQELMRQKGDIRAVKAEIKARQLRYADMLIEARSLRDKSELVKQGALQAKAENAATLSEWEQEQRRALMRTETKKVAQATTRTTQTSTGGKPNAGQATRVANLRNLHRIRAQLREAEKSGALKAVVGWEDKLGVNSVQDFFGGLPPDQRRALTALQELGVGNLMQLIREPNNLRTQDMVQNLGVPKNDRDIGVALQRYDEIISQYEQDIKNAPVGAPDEADEVR